MATKYGYLVDPNKQFQYKNGKNLTSGYLRVFDANTDDPAPTYSNWQLTPNPQNITLDDNGRAVVICDSSKSYRLEVFSYDGELLWTIEPLTCMGGGGSSVSVGVQDIISTDQSVQVDIHNGIADLSANKGDPQVIVTSSNTLTEDGQFTFTTATSRSGNKLNIVDGQVVSAKQYIHFEATVALVWAGAANASTEVSLVCLDTTEKRDFDLSFAHTEYLDVSADYEVSTENTPLYVTVLNLYPGMTATVENFSVHAVTKRYGDGSEYRAGNGILIQTGEISIDPTVVQEKLEAGANISIVGNVISATAEPQQPADWAATEGVTRILNKPDLDIYATHSEVTYGLAQKQDTISDLSTIRSGAAAGATAVQPSEMSSALAGKQDVISDLSTIRSGAAKGATSVQPADLAPYAVASDVESALAGKQDVISDLSTIRSGASAGATAVQPATMNSALAGKQDVISDLNTIRSGAASGATAVQPATMNSALAGKQDVISDLSDIRSGAAAGATAVQPADMASALAGKQDVISDLSDIRSGAAAGATAVQPADMNSALAGKQDVISDLATIRSGAAAGATAVQPADMNTALAGKEDAANKSQTLDPASTTQFPSSAATASFVNSSVATNTATFRGNFKLPDLGLTYPATDAQIEAALDAHVWPVGVVPTNNDYVYVEIENPQTTGVDDVVKRFKYNGTDWHYEYTLNNSSFTAAEKAAIDSGIDAAKVAIYDAHVANGDIHVTPTEKATWNAKQDAISDLSTIRSGAAAGATAVQDPDYVHTDENFTSAEKTKLAGIEAGAQVNVNADWNAASGTDAYIANKPQNLVQDANYVHTDENFTSSDKSKLAGIEAGAEVNVKPDWNAVAGSDDEILNKPAIPGGTQLVPAATASDADKVLTVDAHGVPGWANAQAPISAGSGIDITNNTVSVKVDGSSVSINAQGQLQSAAGAQADWAETDPADPSYIVAKPIPKTLAAGNGISITENQSTITISNTATPPTVDQTYDASSTNAQSGAAVASAISNKQDTLTAGTGIAINSNVISANYNETVLWSSSTSATSFTVSELLTNFQRLKVKMKYNGMTVWCDGTIVSNAQFTIACAGFASNSGDANRLQVFGGSFTSSNGYDFASEAGRCIYFANGSNAIGGGSTGACELLTVIGVNRIASN